MPTKISLPIDPLLPSIQAWLEEHRNLVLTAEPGAGKTTRVPASLLNCAFLGQKQVWVLQPRRLAAKVAAERVAQELETPLGQQVGYQFRFERKEGPQTRLKYLTEGLLLRLAQSKPGLQNVGAVILDEFHERSLSLDLGLAWLKQMQERSRPDLRLVVMSATLDSGAVANYLSDCQVFHSEGRRFPVDLEYLPLEEKPKLEDKVKAGLESLLRKGLVRKGVLVFLPGVGEIKRCQKALESLAEKQGWNVMGLYGDLPPAEQARVLEPSKKPKIILSTNIAETSLTLQGVQAVIDSGLARQARSSFWSGLSHLVTVPISQASATQRAGRAGRTEPGYCLRLYSKYDFEHRPAYDSPEIMRSELCEGVLDLRCLGIDELGEFPFFQQPTPAALSAADSTLRQLEALDDHGKITNLGRELAKLPLHPRLGRFLHAAAERGSAEPRQPSKKKGLLWQACKLAVLLSEEKLQDLLIWQDLDKYYPEGQAEKLCQQLSETFGAVSDHSKLSEKDIVVLQQALLAGFTDRVGRVRRLKNQGARAKILPWEMVLAQGGSVAVTENSFLREGDFYLVLEVQDGGAGSGLKQARSLSPIGADWLLDVDGMIHEEDEIAWNDQSQKAYAFRQLRYGNLVLDEYSLSGREEDISRVLCKEALAAGLGRFWPEEQKRQCAGRMELAATLAGEKWMMPDNEALIKAACQGRSSFAELESLNWEDMALAGLSPAQRSLLERLAPLQVRLKGGRTLKLHYEQGKAPWGASRLQDFFGMPEGPKLGDGKMAVILQLLAPSQRPVQITADLGSFWKKDYPALRRELMRKYPKHAWPENPLQI